jgi:8-oxo-dGTP pyrophosphatase MutT (NUDIX family)
MITAGIYLRYRNRFAFMFGPNKENTHHGVVRFGGHINDGESDVECALREVREEANVGVALSNSPKTYYVRQRDAPPSVADQFEHPEPRPILISGGTMASPRAAMFVGSTEETPMPSMETRGILFLTPGEINRICAGDVSLHQFIQSNGQSVEKERLDRQLRLVPYLQLRFLQWAINHNAVRA